jgi:hypothetical protein
MEKDWVVVYDTTQSYQAEIARDILENSGIKTVILNQADSSYLTFGSISVYVNRNDELQASELLKKLKN